MRTSDCSVSLRKDWKIIFSCSKNTMATHMLKIHNSEDDPLDIVTDKKRHIWADAMKRCFPEFADDTGFYEPTLKVY